MQFNGIAPVEVFTSTLSEAKPNHITVHVTRTQSTKGFRVATGQATSLITTVH